MKRILIMMFVLAVGLSVASLAFASPAKSTVKKKTTDLDSAVSFLKKHNKPEIVGKVITALKKDGYRVTEMLYGGADGEWGLAGFSVSLKGRHDIEILCEVPGLSNAKRENRLGISFTKEEDSFSWEGGKFRNGSTAHCQKVLQKILENLTVTSVEVELPRISSLKRKALWEYGNNIIQKLQPKLGKPAKKEFFWKVDEPEPGWHVEWGKPTKYEFNSVYWISGLRVIVEEAKD